MVAGFQVSIDGRFSGVHRGVRRQELAFERAPLPSDPTVEVLRVDFGRDVGAAVQLAASIFVEVFRSPAVCVSMEAIDVSPIDEIV
ncbi:MAG: hypothetical protein M3411_03125, partial [Chloroflexota bacterium]|nr:hypothetical protein [Chloroflexota bacterium]